MPYRLGVVYENGIIRFTSDEFETWEEAVGQWKPGEIVFSREAEEKAGVQQLGGRSFYRSNKNEIVMHWQKETVSRSDL